MKRLSLLGLLITGVVHAHSAPHVTRFVASDGVDQGNCDQPQAPCRSFDYVFAKSSKGDNVKVAQGNYHLRGESRFAVLSGVISVEGGYSRRDAYAQRSAANTTFLSGVPADYATALSRKGFETVQDAKAGDFAPDSAEQKQFAAYRKMTEKVEGEAACVNGKAGAYACNKMDLLSHIPLGEFSKPAGEANDIWGFVDKNDNHEYILIGLDVGTAVVDVTDPKHPKEVGTIGGVVNEWRDIAVYQYFDSTTNRWKSYAYITSEGVQGLQIIDLTSLPNAVKDAGTISTYFTRAHTLYINTDYAYGTAVNGLTPTLYIAGANVNGGSWQALDLVDPLLPKQIFQRAGAARSEYMHDATGMLLTDARVDQCAPGHNPCEILFDYNERSLVIWDTTDKTNPVKLSDTPYTQVGYTHSGWYSKDKMYLFLNDELDESDFRIPTALRTFDISNLKAPTVVAQFNGPTHAIDHNTYVVGDYSYISHYRRGVVMMNVKDPVHISEEGYFDTSAAYSDDSATFHGAWGVYPFLPSGTIAVSDLEGGLYLVKYDAAHGGGTTPTPTPTPTPSNSDSGGGSTPLLLFVLSGVLGLLRKQLR